MTFTMNGLALWHMQPLKPCVSNSSTIHLHQSIHPINNAVMTNRLITPQLAEQFKQYPLYSQDGRRRMPFANASSSSAKSVGMYWKVSRKAMTSRCSLSLSVFTDTEYGYASIKGNGKYPSVDVGHNLPKIPILQDKSFKPCPIETFPTRVTVVSVWHVWQGEEV